MELKNLKYRIEKNPKGEKLDKLEEIYVALYRRNNIEWFSPKYNSIVYAVRDIIPSNNSLYSDKIEDNPDDTNNTNKPLLSLSDMLKPPEEPKKEVKKTTIINVVPLAAILWAPQDVPVVDPVRELQFLLYVMPGVRLYNA